MSRLFSGTPFDKPITCPRCGKAAADCRCLNLPEKKKMGDRAGGVGGAAGGGKQAGPGRLDSGLVLTPKNSAGPKDQVAKIRREKRKGNRVVTVITGLEHPGNDLAALCTELKQALGVGGSVQGRSVELQGDHGEAVKARLEEKGIRSRVL